MAMRSSMYSSNKRKKELMRQKKQEEKRLKRQGSTKAASQEPGVQDPMNIESGPSADTPAVTDK
ncbi:MAG: hypothetical protein HY758_00195 [Nitrospirae bacterium]|nr:hypothetical protein [Nitrospirota bacterium]